MAAEPVNEAGPAEADDPREELAEVKQERDAYQNAALAAQANELNLHRRLHGFLEVEIAQLTAEVRALRSRGNPDGEER